MTTGICVQVTIIYLWPSGDLLLLQCNKCFSLGLELRVDRNNVLVSGPRERVSGPGRVVEICARKPPTYRSRQGVLFIIADNIGHGGGAGPLSNGDIG
jgi:hypothetical protein